MYKLSVKKQKTKQKRAKPSKKGGFPSPSDQLAEFEQILTGSKSVRADFDWSKSVRADFDWSKSTTWGPIFLEPARDGISYHLI